MKTVHALAVGSMLVVFGCTRSREPSPLPLIAPPGPSSEPLVAEHALRGAVIRDEIERGDLARAREAANALVELVTKYEEPTPESRLEAMVEASRRVAAARDLPEAARSFAFLAERCGECHVRIGGPASFPAAAPPDALTIVPRMRRHHWGAARLWEGLVAPSDEAWRSGADVLSDAPLLPAPPPGRTLAPDIEPLAVAVHDLGVRASTAKRASARIEIYGELLATCAKCHERVRPTPR